MKKPPKVEARVRGKPMPKGGPPGGLVVATRPLSELRAADKNPKRHASQAIEASVEKFGFAEPLVLDERTGRLVAGHGRREVLLRLKDRGTKPPAGITLGEDGEWLVPVVLWRSKDDAEAAAFLLAANQTTIAGGVDQTALDEMIRDLNASIDLRSLGFSEADLYAAIEAGAAGVGDLPREEQEIDPESRIPDLPKNPQTKPGDLWILGDHRIVCGDSTDPRSSALAFDGAEPGVLFTSPPYIDRRDYGKKIDDWDGLMRGVFGACVLPKNAQVLVNIGVIHDGGRVVRFWEKWLDWMEADPQSWRLFGWYVWDKMTPTFGANAGRAWTAHEWLFHFNRESVPCAEWVPCATAGGPRSGGQRGADGVVRPMNTLGIVNQHKPPDSVLHIQRDTNSGDASVNAHPARFPVELPTWGLRTWPGDVFDPFLGSGTTVIAAERLGRRCFGVELDPRYVEVAVGRWENFTGKKADRRAAVLAP